MAKSSVMHEHPRSDRRRGIILAACFAVGLSLLYFAAVKLPGSPGNTGPFRAHAGGDDQYTGLIILPGDRPRECRAISLDNYSGKVTDSRVIDCDAAITKDGKKVGATNGASRLRAIGDFFSHSR